MKKMFTILLLAGLMLFSNAPQADAAFEWQVSEWSIPSIGVMKAPIGFSAVEVKDFRNFIDQEKNKLTDPKRPKAAKENKPLPAVPPGTPTILSEALPADTDAAEKRFLKSDFSLYHLTVDDGEAIHMAWFLAARDGETLPPSVDVFTKELTAEQTEQLDGLKKWVDENINKAQYTDEKNKVSIKLLEMLPLQSLPRQDGKLWTTGARVMITAEDMPFAFFSRIYAMSVDNHLTVGVLAGFDGERPFWDPVIREMLLGLQEKPVTK